MNPTHSNRMVAGRVSQWSLLGSVMSQPASIMFDRASGISGQTEQSDRADGCRRQGEHYRPRRLAVGVVTRVRVVVRFAEERAHHDGKEIGGIEEGAQDDDANGQPLAGLHGTAQHEPFAEEARRRRHPDHAEGPDGESPHRPRHASPDALELAHLGLVRRRVNRARCEEQRDFAHRVRGDVHGCADHRDRGQYRRREHDVGELRDGRVCEQPFQIVLPERDQRGHDHRGARHIDQPTGVPGRAQRLNAEDVNHDLDDREHAGLHHGHGMEQGADRGRRHHRRRQPRVQRHDRRLADSEDVESEQDAADPAAGLALENAAGGEVDRAGQDPGRHDCWQQQDRRGAEQHDEIDSARPDGFGVGLVRDERIGRQRQRLVEQEQREQVLGEGDGHGGAERHCKADVVRCLARLVVGAHVADRIDRGDDPEGRGYDSEQESERLDLEGQGEAGDDLEVQRLRLGAGKDRRQQAEHDEKQGQRGQQRHALA